MTKLQTTPQHTETEIEYIRRIADRINITALAETIGYSTQNLHKVIRQVPDAGGRVRKLPAKYLPALQRYIEDLQRR